MLDRSRRASGKRSALAAINLGANAQAQSPVTLTMGMSEPSSTPSHLAAERIAELVAERSDGQI